MNTEGFQERENLFRCPADGHSGVEELAQQFHGCELSREERGGKGPAG
ncbi:hypothetical protein [Streptomyces sp. NPDC088847]